MFFKLNLYHHPKSIVCIRIHLWYWTFTGFDKYVVTSIHLCSFIHNNFCALLNEPLTKLNQTLIRCNWIKSNSLKWVKNSHGGMSVCVETQRRERLPCFVRWVWRASGGRLSRGVCGIICPHSIDFFSILWNLCPVTFLFSLSSFHFLSSKVQIHLQCRWCRKCGFDPRFGKIPWRSVWQATPVFLPGESHGQRSLVGCSP